MVSELYGLFYTGSTEYLLLVPSNGCFGISWYCFVSLDEYSGMNTLILQVKLFNCRFNGFVWSGPVCGW